jgi:hypothetical protein
MKGTIKTGLFSLSVLVVTGVTAVAVKAQDPFPLPPQPNGACIAKDGSCQVTPQGICKLSKGTWLGPNTTCPTTLGCTKAD